MSTDDTPPNPAPEPLAALLRSHPKAAFDYLEFRLIVASLAARMAAEQATEDDRDALTRAFQAVETTHGADDPSDEAEADAEFHLAIYAASHNTVMQHIMRSVFQLLRLDIFYDRRRLYRREGVRDSLLRQHKAIYDAIMARDPESARAAAETHILYARDVLQESRVSEQRLEVSLRRIGRDSLAAVSDREAQ